MKTHEFKTDKGEFVIDDIDKTELLLYSVFNNTKPKSVRCGIHLQPLFSLSEATEEDAKGVVDEHNHYFNDGTIDYSFRDYRVVSEFDEPSRLPYALKSLHSLLRSKGIDINNGNWYLFKKI